MGWYQGPLNSPMNGQPKCHRSHPFGGARVSSVYIYLALVLPFPETLAAGGGEESVVAAAAMVNTSMVTDFWVFLFLLDCDFILHLFLLSFFFIRSSTRENQTIPPSVRFSFCCTVMISRYVFFWLPENLFWRTTTLNLLEVLVKIFSGSRILGNQRD